ncbi:MAG: HlyD family secretion protein, partial [Desulfobacteraceae bacterium]
LKRENSQLNIFASISGVIGSVNYKVGEKVTPFAPIITLHPKTPSIIKGYIRENEYSMISVGDKLSIISQADARNQVKGSVIGVGARIVEYPERLRKRPELMAWGREITVKIPADNNLILGEKVMICLEGKNKSLWNVLRDAIFPQDTIAGPPKTEVHLSTDISEVSYSTVLPVIPLDDSSIEASAMVYLPNKDEYLLASDETPKKRLILYLMDDSGQITKEYPIDGIDKIDDIESMTCDEQGTIYIAASMSAKGNGKMPKNRRLLVTIKQDDSGFYLYKSVDLFDLLEECAEENKNKQWAKYLLNGIDNEQTDVEGIFWDDNALFLGFKAPFFMDRSVILKISQIDQLLENKELTASQISIWKMLSLKGNNFNKQESISDLFYHDGNLFITGVPLLQHEKERSGSLWQLDLNANQLTHLIQFKDLQPEGIAAAKNVDSLLICFDQGSHYQSQITLIKGLQ